MKEETLLEKVIDCCRILLWYLALFVFLFLVYVLTSNTGIE